MTSRCSSLLLITIVASVALTGCVGATDAAPSNPTVGDSTLAPASAPTQSKDALLAEAVDVINNYNALLIQLLSDHSIDASLLSPYATSSAVDKARAAQDRMAAEGKYLLGNQTISNALLQEADAAGIHLTVLTCDEFGEVRVLREGSDVTPPDRRSRSTRQVTLVREDGTLRVEGSFVWDGASVCN